MIFINNLLHPFRNLSQREGLILIICITSIIIAVGLGYGSVNNQDMFFKQILQDEPLYEQLVIDHPGNMTYVNNQTKLHTQITVMEMVK